MKYSVILVVAVVLITALTGCAFSRLSYSTAPSTSISHDVRTIAVAPRGGLLADAIAIEFAKAGYQVVDTLQMTRLLIRLKIGELEITEPQNLALLKGAGIDAYLFVRAVAGYDGRPQSVNAILNSTHTGLVIAGVTWRNGWGGQTGSIADRTMRKNIPEAARDIGAALLRALPGKEEQARDGLLRKAI